MAPSDYASAGSGKLKLKGVKDAKVDKKKKKKPSSKPKDEAGDANDAGDSFKDKSVMLKSLEDEDEQLAKEERRMIGMVDGKEVGPGAGMKDDEEREIVKTEAEKRHEEQRRKRVCYARLPTSYTLHSTHLEANFLFATARRSTQARRRKDAQGTGRRIESLSQQSQRTSRYASNRSRLTPVHGQPLLQFIRNLRSMSLQA
jgi:protein FAM32A